MHVCVFNILLSCAAVNHMWSWRVLGRSPLGHDRDFLFLSDTCFHKEQRGAPVQGTGARLCTEFAPQIFFAHTVTQIIYSQRFCLSPIQQQKELDYCGKSPVFLSLSLQKHDISV